MLSPKSTKYLLICLGAGILCLFAWKICQPVDSTDTSDFRASQITPRVKAPVEDRFDSIYKRIRSSTNRNDSISSLKELQDMLKSMPPEEAVAWIRAFLAKGDDKPTGLSFIIAKGGSLEEWPTFRTFLIDALYSIDPAAAAAISREILATPTSADEWALALRNVGKSELTAENSDYLIAKTEELILNKEWQENPSIGYLNAFDVLVATNATTSTPLISDLIQRKDRKDLAHAGFLTLDRLVQRQPVEMLEQLSNDGDLQQSRPEMVSQQFARADIRDETQREILKTWMLDPTRTPAELRSFSGVYPNNNKFISNNLLTTESGQSGVELNAHDRAALEIITSWANEPEFQPVNEYLLTMIRRLDGFVNSSGQ